MEIHYDTRESKVLITLLPNKKNITCPFPQALYNVTLITFNINIPRFSYITSERNLVKKKKSKSESYTDMIFQTKKQLKKSIRKYGKVLEEILNLSSKNFNLAIFF